MPSQARLANEAWEAMLTAHASLMKEFAAQDIWGELSMREYDVLYTLAKSPDALRPTDLGRRVLLSQPALSRLVERLVARGLIERAADPDDGRGSRLSLTPAGRELQRATGAPHARQVTRAMSAGLSDEQLVSLRRLCEALATSAAG